MSITAKDASGSSVAISTEVRGTYSIKTMNGVRSGSFTAKRCNKMAMCG